jgi:hypothetical protein
MKGRQNGDVPFVAEEPVMRVAYRSSSSVVRRLILPAIVAVALALGGVTLGEGTASAQVIEVAPPAVRVEVVGRPPSPRHFWIPGYWAWQGGRHAWARGHWEVSRPGWAWTRARWAHEGHHWRFAPGRWHRR